MVLAKGVDIDEVAQSSLTSLTSMTSCVYRNIDASGAVTGPEQERWVMSWDSKWRHFITGRLSSTRLSTRSVEHFLVGGVAIIISATGPKARGV